MKLRTPREVCVGGDGELGRLVDMSLEDMDVLARQAEVSFRRGAHQAVAMFVNDADERCLTDAQFRAEARRLARILRDLRSSRRQYGWYMHVALDRLRPKHRTAAP